MALGHLEHPQCLRSTELRDSNNAHRISTRPISLVDAINSTLALTRTRELGRT